MVEHPAHPPDVPQEADVVANALARQVGRQMRRKRPAPGDREEREDERGGEVGNAAIHRSGV